MFDINPILFYSVWTFVVLIWSYVAIAYFSGRWD